MLQKVAWRWSDFKPEEVLSPKGLSLYYTQDTLMYSPVMLTVLSQFRQQIGKPILINHAGLTLRGFRSCPENKLAGGELCSMHLLGIAADCTVTDMTVAELAAAAEKSQLFSGMGVYPSRGFVHLDIRCKTDGLMTRWGE